MNSAHGATNALHLCVYVRGDSSSLGRQVRKSHSQSGSEQAQREERRTSAASAAAAASTAGERTTCDDDGGVS